MKKVIACLAACAALTGWNALAGDGELKNGSFEDSDTSAENIHGDRAEAWGRWGNWINRESEWSPVRSGKCIIGYHHWQIGEDDNSGLYQDVADVPPGKQVTFSVYASKDEKANFESIEMRLETFNGGETLASQTYKLDEVGSGWTKLSVSGTTKGEGVRTLVIVNPKKGGGRDGALRLDDAELEVEK